MLASPVAPLTCDSSEPVTTAGPRSTPPAADAMCTQRVPPVPGPVGSQRPGGSDDNRGRPRR